LEDTKTLLQENAPEESKKRPKTIGERVHFATTYLGFDWVLNATFGVAFTYFTSRTALGRKWWTDPIEQKAQSWLKLNETGAKWFGNFLSIMMGGTVTLPPIMWLEKNKRDLVENLDRKVYGDEAVDTEERFKEAYEDIENEPPKSFGIGMLTRFMALAPLIGMAVAMPRRLTRNVYDKIGEGTKWVAEKSFIRPKSMMETMEQDDTLGGEISKWDALHRLIGFDFGLSFVYAFLHEWSYSAVSAFKHKDDASPEADAKPKRKHAGPTLAYEHEQNTQDNVEHTPAIAQHGSDTPQNILSAADITLSGKVQDAPAHEHTVSN